MSSDDLSVMPLAQLRQLMSEKYGVVNADKMSRANLIANYRKLAVEEEFDPLAIVEDESACNVEDNTEVVPEQDSPEWHEYVMSQFRQGELVDGCPNVMGLRRVARKVIGPIVEDTVKTIAVPDERVKMAVVEATIAFDAYGVRVVFSDVADVSPANSVMPYLNHPTSTAASKAASRALRKALGLTNVLSAEEKTPETVSHAASVFGENEITYIQTRILEELCKRNNVNLVKFVNSGDRHYNSLGELTEAAASKLIERFNDERESIVNNEELVGFDESWSTYFSKE